MGSCEYCKIEYLNDYDPRHERTNFPFAFAFFKLFLFLQRLDTFANAAVKYYMIFGGIIGG